ncbi:hypothetical protein PI126_g16118 [Phytophthora idaei]|nr:hypothetical protein PI126_g16118 [Phytophthora idaei]
MRSLHETSWTFLGEHVSCIVVETKHAASVVSNKAQDVLQEMEQHFS